jgi:NADH-quinone oxidoreductase subunit C
VSTVDPTPGDGSEPGTEAPPDAAAEAAERYGVPASLSRDQLVLHPDRSGYLELAARLKDEGYVSCVDVTAVDYLTHRAPRHLPEGVTAERYEVVVGLLSHRGRHRIRLRVQVPEGEPTCPSLWPVHAGSEALEREVFDMFGITFDEHPDMTRILMPESWQGHPLRKDYPIGRIPVQFKAAPSAR